MKKYLEKFVSNIEPKFKPRWEIYNQTLLSLLNNETNWVDVGCGQNQWVTEFGNLAKTAIGTDLYYPKNSSNFIIKDNDSLPFVDNSVNLITLRFVVEHIKDINKELKEYSRVLKKGGKVMLLTTNSANPLIRIAQYIPEKIKTPFLSKSFNVSEEHIFPTTHPLNKPSDFKNLPHGFKLSHIEYISDLNTGNLPFFIIFYLMHFVTKPKFLNQFRMNLLAIIEKT
jgi:SAM-dependent methyltransferase